MNNLFVKKYKLVFLVCSMQELLVSNKVYMYIFISREPLPGEWDTKLDSFQKLLILRCLRADCLIQGLQDFLSAHLGQRFIEPQVKISPSFSGLYVKTNTN